MKTNKQVDEIMAATPREWRHRWCGGERGPCACMGCVQTGNKQVIMELITGKTYAGDPEYISEFVVRAHKDVYEANKISYEEWLAWKERHATR